MDRCETTRQVIEALGGIDATARLTKRSYNAASNWLGFGRFPSNTYIAMTAALSDRGKSAPASLWGMVEAEHKEPESAA